MSKKCDEVVLPLIKEGKTVQEIAKLTEFNEATVRLCGKRNNIDIKTIKTKIDNKLLQQIKEGVLAGEVNVDLAKRLGISATTCRKYTKKLGLETNSVKTKPKVHEIIKLNKDQIQIIFGSLLGDLSIGYQGNECRLSFNQGGTHEAYFDYVCSFFKGLLGKVNKSDRYDKRTNKWYHKYAVRSLTNPIFTKIHNICYPNGKKTITEKQLKFLTPMGLAFWFMDDGTNSGTIATNCFSTEECELLIDWFNRHNILASIQHGTNNGHVQNLIYIHVESRKHFYDLVEPYIIPEMMYKFVGWNPKVKEFREPLSKENSEPSILDKDKGATTSNS